ncbi:MAG: sigma-70 family RNA polymerase sigma factor [Phycisphaerales bacterium]
MEAWDGDGQVGDVSAAIDGDRDALRRVWQEHRRWVAAILIAYKPKGADLDDLLQIVAVQLVRKLRELREPEAFRPWLRTVAINVARAEGRKTTRATPVLRLTRDEDAPPTDSGAPDPAQLEEAGRLLELASRLPDAYREPLLLRCLRGMSYRQIGAVMDLPETTIETRIARGRRMLRDMALSGETPKDEETDAKTTKARSGWSVVV